HVARWRSGAVIGDDPAAAELAARLLASGILLPDPVPTPAPLSQWVTVAVPVRDRSKELARCLNALRSDDADVRIIVVDDASSDAAAIARVASDHGAAVVRLDRRSGPAGARNAALGSAETPL